MAGVAGPDSGIPCGWSRPSSIPRRRGAPERRARRKAQKAGRTITAPTLAVAGWLLLITTLDAATWSTADVLYVYRARWQVELVFKKMKQLLRLNQIRSKHRTSVEATVRALLIAWALHESTTTWLRTLLSATTSPASVVVSRLVVERAGAGYAAAAGAGQVVGGPPPGVPPPFAALSLQSSTASGASGMRGADMAGTTSQCTLRQTATSGMKKPWGGERAVSTRIWEGTPSHTAYRQHGRPT